MWQGQEVVQVGSGRLVTIFIGLAALALLSQAVVVVAVGVGLLKAQKALMAHVNDIKAKVMPVVDKAQALVADATAITADLKPKIKQISDDLTPKIKDISDDLKPKIKQISADAQVVSGHAAEISGLVKDKVAEFGPTVTATKETLETANQTVLEATQKTHEQLLRVNAMITDSLNATEKLGRSIRHTVTQPGREIAGIASGVKAAVSKFFDTNGGAPKDPPPPAAEPYRPYVATPYSAATERRREEEDIAL